MSMRIMAGERRLNLDKPLGDDGLLLQADNLFYSLKRVSVEDMAEVMAENKNRELRGYPIWFAEYDGGVDLFPTPVEVFHIIRVVR